MQQHTLLKASLVRQQGKGSLGIKTVAIAAAYIAQLSEAVCVLLAVPISVD